jgi:hypothetical protein
MASNSQRYSTLNFKVEIVDFGTSGVNFTVGTMNKVCLADPAGAASAVSMTLLVRHQRCQLHCGFSNANFVHGTSGVNYTADSAMQTLFTGPAL